MLWNFDRLEGGIAVGGVGLDDSHHLVDVDVDVRRADAVARGGDRDRDAALHAVDGSHALEVERLPRVHLDDDLAGGVEELDVVADA